MNRREGGRETQQQRGPAPGADLGDFPTTTPPDLVHRAHREDRSPGWFSSAGCRFDLPAPSGTLYAADSVATAIRERLGPVVAGAAFVFRSDVAEVTVSAVRISGRFANISDPAAVRWGVLRELATMTPYDVPVEWAQAFRSVDHDGVRYASRFTTEPGPSSWAVFGASGAASVPALSSATGEDACTEAGIEVRDPPRDRRGLTVMSPRENRSEDTPRARRS